MLVHAPDKSKNPFRASLTNGCSLFQPLQQTEIHCFDVTAHSSLQQLVPKLYHDSILSITE